MRKLQEEYEATKKKLLKLTDTLDLLSPAEERLRDELEITLWDLERQLLLAN